VMRVPAYEPSVGWLTEGIADYVRDVLGFESAHTFATFRHGGAMRGYQSTAHFLMWLGRRRPGAVEDVSRRLSAGSYDVDVFRDLTGTPLYELVDTYEVEHEDRPIRRWGAPH
jgi:hypothetical protein